MKKKFLHVSVLEIDNEYDMIMNKCAIGICKSYYKGNAVLWTINLEILKGWFLKLENLALGYLKYDEMLDMTELWNEHMLLSLYVCIKDGKEIIYSVAKWGLW